MVERAAAAAGLELKAPSHPSTASRPDTALLISGDEIRLEMRIAMLMGGALVGCAYEEAATPAVPRRGLIRRVPPDSRRCRRSSSR
jgi:hypothetical protein